MAVRIDREYRVIRKVQQPAGGRTSSAFNPHPSHRTRRNWRLSSGGPEPQASIRRILFVEDDRFIADMYRMKLEADGWNIEVAADGEAGLRRALEDPPALILLDILLPRLDGLEVLRRLRADERTSKVPVLILSNALGIAGREKEARSLGIADWVVKANTTPAQLTARVAKLLAD